LHCAAVGSTQNRRLWVLEEAPPITYETTDHNRLATYLEYVRKSSEDAERQVLSLESQHDAIHERFPDLDIKCTKHESASAFIPDNRPIFADHLSQIERGEAQGLVAWHPNRLSRNEIDAARIIRLLRTDKLKDLKFVTYHFENTPEGIWMLQLILSQSQYESAKLGRDVLRGMTKKAQLGQFPSRVPPGYLNSGPTNEKGTRFVYDDPERLPLLHKVVRLGLTGDYTKADLHRMLVEWGFKTRKTKAIGGHPLSYSQFDRMIRNVFYTGHFMFRGQLYRGNHTPIMTLAEYDLLQRTLSRFGDGQRRGPGKRDYIKFAGGLVRCGTCGCAITATETRKHYAGTGRDVAYVYYHCTRKRKGIACKEPAIKDHDFQAELATIVSKYRISMEFRDLALRYIAGEQQQRRKNNQRIIALRTQERDSVNRRLGRLIDMRADGELDERDFKDRRAACRKQIADLDREIRTLTSGLYTDDVVRATTGVLDSAARASERFINGTTDDKRQVLLSMCENLTLSNGKVLSKAKKWLQPIGFAYSRVEATYELARTWNFGSPNDRMAPG
jgi:site-specific DNA recombinase